MACEICQSKLKILPDTKWTHSKWPKFFNYVPNFAKSGHTEADGIHSLREGNSVSQLFNKREFFQWPRLKILGRPLNVL